MEHMHLHALHQLAIDDATSHHQLEQYFVDRDRNRTARRDRVRRLKQRLFDRTPPASVELAV